MEKLNGLFSEELQEVAVLLSDVYKNKDAIEKFLDSCSKNKKKKPVNKMNIGEKCVFGGIEWYKFKESANGNSYFQSVSCVGDECSFGNNNQWDGSNPQRIIMESIIPAVNEELGKQAIIPYEFSLISMDGFDTYGTTTEEIWIMNHRCFQRNRRNIILSEKCEWLCTPWSTLEGDGDECNVVVSPSGGVSINDCDDDGSGVRPCCILESSILVSCV